MTKASISCLVSRKEKGKFTTKTAMAWGWLSWNGVGNLVEIDGIITPNSSTDILKMVLLLRLLNSF